MDDTSLRLMQLASQGFCCSQIMIKLSLEDMGEENSGLVRAAAGLCDGLGVGDLCGVASGGACIIALYAAKGTTKEEQLDSYPLLLSEFMDWFKVNSTNSIPAEACCTESNPDLSTDTSDNIKQKTHHLVITRCDDILASAGHSKPESCGNLMLRSREKILQLLTEHGIDPSLPREQTNEY